MANQHSACWLRGFGHRNLHSSGLMARLRLDLKRSVNHVASTYRTMSSIASRSRRRRPGRSRRGRIAVARRDMRCAGCPPAGGIRPGSRRPHRTSPHRQWPDRLDRDQLRRRLPGRDPAPNCLFDGSGQDSQRGSQRRLGDHREDSPRAVLVTDLAPVVIGGHQGAAVAGLEFVAVQVHDRRLGYP
jgi:hypothetical protein